MRMSLFNLIHRDLICQIEWSFCSLLLTFFKANATELHACRHRSMVNIRVRCIRSYMRKVGSRMIYIDHDVDVPFKFFFS